MRTSVGPGFFALLTLMLMTVGLMLGHQAGDVTSAAAPQPGVVAETGHRVVVFEAPGCGWCARFREYQAPSYEASDVSERAPLSYVRLRTREAELFGLRGEITVTPTFVIVDGNRQEIGRLTGYPRNSRQLTEYVESVL